ncbi:glucose-1-phosphate adenylyltransferase [Salisediminibacterium beveridgei]|uniref:Glucose-1-phosphate adenylyltransferase n=1 Tax=Salisediminibacterium beveridgei TaxID=632773 RepID=A0A1D7QSY3_9BACI|nr:glucose-1-phosphate adenylyltransferase [Salisediminibacterium beveridgei]AOM82125.1 Glucose-1-phosphate adenylyltransferase [Salisediminibacterium beveridgei]
MKKEVIGMLLAGGKGTRLGLLTDAIAKPAVHFGGKYRIIDFTLSNCSNSKIHTVGVLTQYSPLELHKHMGIGKPWDMDRQTDGLSILSPFQASDGASWYSGTADAITKNIHYIDQHDPEYVLVISGDHIYHMDYRKMLEHHKETGASATISVMEVPWDEASRFGILNTKDDLEVYEFDEKPKNPKNNLASMGIYIFTWSDLRQYLVDDEKVEDSDHDFGKDIIPSMLKDGLPMYAYRFDGYWKDVGTIKSYWEANMDLLEEDLTLSLNNKEWRTYSHDSNYPPEYIGETALVKNSLITSGSWIDGTVTQSVLFEKVDVFEGAEVVESIIHPSVKIGKNSKITKAIVMENTTIPDNVVIDGSTYDEPVVINQENYAEFNQAKGVN